MELNLKFYNGKDEYSDGDIEEKIIGFIKKYPNNYEEAFKEDSSWPVFYHLSDMRKNIIRWYPFKENASILEVGGGMGAITSELCQKCKNVTSIELSKRRATAILERNKNVKNLEIIVGNFKDIVLEKKYDYILLNGVLEYGALYMDSENPYEGFINRLKQNLKVDGKILIAIENRFGLKYWCGANEDHTNRVFDGINGYKNQSEIKTFSKKDLEDLFTKLNFHYNFYYPLPNYKFSEIILTDEFIENDNTINYTPYYCNNFKMFGNEKRVFADIIHNKKLDFFANSYFIELSLKKCKKEITFVKNNDLRARELALYTYKINNKFYKKAKYEEGFKHIQNIIKYDTILQEHKIKTLKINIEDNSIYTEFCEYKPLANKLLEICKENNLQLLIENINNYIDFLKNHFKKERITEKTTTIFEKYKLKIDKQKKDKMYFIKDGFIDLIFQNILINDEEYIAFDQEWYEENVPIEYIVYRAIRIFVFHHFSNNDYSEYLKKLYAFILDNINLDLKKNRKLFEKLEEKIIDQIKGEDEKIEVFNKYVKYENYEEKINDVLENYEQLEKSIQEQDRYIKSLEAKIKVLSEDLNSVNEAYNMILNSKTWKLRTKIDKIVHRK